MPTRNRQSLALDGVEFFIREEVPNVELIVVDSSEGGPCPELEGLCGRGIRYLYVGPGGTMDQNWEIARNLATGEYIAVWGDKYLFLPTALLRLTEALSEGEWDLVSWRFRRAIPETRDVLTPHQSHYVQISDRDLTPELAREFSPGDVLVSRKANGTHHLPADLEHLGYGLSSAYRRSMTIEIAKKYGGFYLPICPDYTCTCLALTYAKKALEMRDLMSLAVKYKGNGGEIEQDSGKAKQFFSASGVSAQELPIPCLTGSVENWVARDMYLTAKKFTNGCCFDDLDWDIFLGEVLKPIKKSRQLTGSKFRLARMLTVLKRARALFYKRFLLNQMKNKVIVANSRRELANKVSSMRSSWGE